MRTEITIPVAFDTTPLEEKMKRDGEAELERIMREIVMEGVEGALPSKATYAYGISNGGYQFREERGAEIDWGKYVKGIFHGFLEDHIEEIIDEAALLLAFRGAKRKAWKEVLAEMKEEDADGQAD